ncbi:hypothetical protein WR25_11923 [Diploscapter pachys]|uniref:Uncharacterized protein n=1 Tax=Diploscapter pachys TaxID=2018661 RepID=A0A2A2LTT0_9BILA|nr:hypothetical protein WR25_11923 [Diploscapter pachys]
MRTCWCALLVSSVLIALFYSQMSGARLASTALRIVYVTVPNHDVGLSIARSVVENKLAACVNIVPGIKSVYIWEGKVNEDSEELLIMKTNEKQLEPLRKEVVRLHPYEVPEFVSLPIDHASEPYGQWVLKNSLPDPAEAEENSS